MNDRMTYDQWAQAMVDAETRAAKPLRGAKSASEWADELGFSIFRARQWLSVGSLAGWIVRGTRRGVDLSGRSYRMPVYAAVKPRGGGRRGRTSDRRPNGEDKKGCEP